MNTRNPILLCVDDEEANLKLLEKLLVPRSYAVICAASGKDALLKIKSQAIDLILLDIIMPGMDGFEVCRQIKEDPKLRSIPVILVTALTDKKDRIRGIEAGAEDFLSKPFDLAEVLARIKMLLKMKGLDDERQRVEAELQKSHAELELKVQERTAELAKANEKLQADLIERIQIEEKLRKSEENFHRSLEESPLGIRIATAKGETIYANKVILDIYGYANVDELNKIPLKERYSLQSYAESQLRKKSRDKGDFEPRIYEINIIRKNGGIRHLQVLRKEILWNGVKKFQVIYQDITERKRAEDALLESEDRYRALFDRSLDLVYIHDFEGHFIDANEAALNLFGYKKDEFRSLDFSSLLSEDQLPFARKTIQEIREKGFQKELTECRLRLRNGNEVYVETKGSAIISKGAYTGIQVLARNITERKQADEKIRNSLVEKEVLLKEVHHRVKNNLMIIIGLIKMQEAKANNEMFNPLLLELEGRIRSMALVHESLYKSADLAHVDLQNYVETLSAQIHAQFGADRDIRFSVQAAGVDVGLDVAVPCGLILNELITNAYKHAFPAGKPGSGAGKCEINVAVNQEGGMNVITVADNGVGLPPDLDWEKSNTLGLKLILMLSRQLNGRVEMDRTHGTIFRLSFTHLAGSGKEKE